MTSVHCCQPKWWYVQRTHGMYLVLFTLHMFSSKIPRTNRHDRSGSFESLLAFCSKKKTRTNLSKASVKFRHFIMCSFYYAVYQHRYYDIWISTILKIAPQETWTCENVYDPEVKQIQTWDIDWMRIIIDTVELSAQFQPIYWTKNGVQCVFLAFAILNTYSTNNWLSNIDFITCEWV